MSARIHDLLEIDAERFLEAHSSAPGWVAESLRHAPFVVVRRGPIPAEEGIAIGVRGAQRNERWAGACRPDLIRKTLTPPMLLSRLVTASCPDPATRQDRATRPDPATCADPATSLDRASGPDPAARADAIPAVRTLALLVDRWKDFDSPWGPGGSVGFELATGHPVATSQSDLDVVIYAESRMTLDEASALCESAQGLPAVVDIRVETPLCGFSLTEYANRAPAPILLRFACGTVLGADPWADLGTASAAPGAARRTTAIPP
jgi:phosphoribosyl-dephospho-CoA transferase